MKNEIKNDFRLAMASKISTPVVEYLEARLADVIEELIMVSVDKVEKLQGKAQELKELIKLTKSARE